MWQVSAVERGSPTPSASSTRGAIPALAAILASLDVSLNGFSTPFKDVVRTQMARRITVRLPFPAQFARNTITHGMKFTM
jgi:hypothetical protein